MKLQPKMKWAICPCCSGNGSVESPVSDNGFTSSEWEEMDDEGREAYMSSGCEVCCTKCGGAGKVRVHDVSAMTFKEKRALVLVRREQRLEAHAKRTMYAEMAAERRMGC